MPFSERIRGEPAIPAAAPATRGCLANRIEIQITGESCFQTCDRRFIFCRYNPPNLVDVVEQIKSLDIRRDLRKLLRSDAVALDEILLSIDHEIVKRDTQFPLRSDVGRRLLPVDDGNDLSGFVGDHILQAQIAVIK